MGRRTTVVVAAAALVVALAACNSSTTEAGGGGGGGGGPVTTADPARLQENVPSTQPGVTDTEIRVTSIGAITNVLGADFTQAPNGTQAYFDMINSQGGIYGRKLVLVDRKDDQMTKNKEAAAGVVSDNAVFAVLPVTTPLFLGAQELSDAGIPTFGWNINADWAGNPGFYGHSGSFIDLENGAPGFAYIVNQLGVKKVGLIAFGIEQSQQCVNASRKAFQKWSPGVEVAFADDTIPYGATDFSVPVQKMRDAGVEIVQVCLDNAASVNLAKEVKKQEADIDLLLANAYESTTAQQFGDVFEGDYVLNFFVPIETDPAPKGLASYKEWIAKVPGATTGEQSLVGWLNADLFYRGLVAAGPEFTQQSVVDAIDQMTRWTADGAAVPTDWTRQHTEAPNPYCFTVSRFVGGKFESQFTEPGKPVLCTDPATTPPVVTKEAAE